MKRLFLALLLVASAAKAAPSYSYFKAALPDKALWPVYQRYNMGLHLCSGPKGMLAYVRVSAEDAGMLALIQLYGDPSTLDEWQLARECKVAGKYPVGCIKCRWVK